MGDTSSGKSSLLSALTQIQLPRNDQITTRCPLRITMEQSATVSAQVGIRWDAKSHYANERAWTVRHLKTWDGIDRVISEAQTTILKLGKIEVAFDVIEVKVFGPDCLDLTLTDLPGIVRSVSKHEPKSIISDIRRSIDFYLANPRCVILAVHPANVDFIIHRFYKTQKKLIR